VKLSLYFIFVEAGGIELKFILLYNAIRPLNEYAQPRLQGAHIQRQRKPLATFMSSHKITERSPPSTAQKKIALEHEVESSRVETFFKLFVKRFQCDSKLISLEQKSVHH